ncbi:MAG: tetratricopeptide repeat protein [Candidatus Cyclonatronum sp.]|uniref:tetratricopeptide repeat protein n=1 Tax=Cyclonatronum sp. TaxID=3024185 RepID=UPI0025C1F8EE|nr:tetratricopeptide repeat protein [Cyclonatronum sp.]MCC5934321.1 tetratricopeptide repeat protein [Balneolales bacterium]MCH8487083.1 tetratricopeptide repeat protein [Cyclonatronum sp.]
MSELKNRLLILSEEIVAHSDRLDEIEFEEQSSERFEIFRKLRSVGDELLELSEQADPAPDDFAFAQFALGSVCALLGYHEKAEAAYDTALEHWPDHVGILNEATDVLVELGKFPKAKSFIQRSIKHGGETPDILYNLASVTAHMGDTAEARIILINTLAKFPHDAGCKALLQELDKASSAS